MSFAQKIDCKVYLLTPPYSYETAIPNKIVSKVWKEYESEQDA